MLASSATNGNSGTMAAIDPFVPCLHFKCLRATSPFLAKLYSHGDTADRYVDLDLHELFIVLAVSPGGDEHYGSRARDSKFGWVPTPWLELVVENLEEGNPLLAEPAPSPSDSLQVATSGFLVPHSPANTFSSTSSSPIPPMTGSSSLSDPSILLSVSAGPTPDAFLTTLSSFARHPSAASFQKDMAFSSDFIAFGTTTADGHLQPSTDFLGTSDTQSFKSRNSSNGGLLPNDEDDSPPPAKSGGPDRRKKAVGDPQATDKRRFVVLIEGQKEATIGSQKAFTKPFRDALDRLLNTLMDVQPTDGTSIAGFSPVVHTVARENLKGRSPNKNWRMWVSDLVWAKFHVLKSSCSSQATQPLFVEMLFLLSDALKADRKDEVQSYLIVKSPDPLGSELSEFGIVSAGGADGSRSWAARMTDSVVDTLKSAPSLHPKDVRKTVREELPSVKPGGMSPPQITKQVSVESLSSAFLTILRDAALNADHDDRTNRRETVMKLAEKSSASITALIQSDGATLPAQSVQTALISALVQATFTFPNATLYFGLIAAMVEKSRQFPVWSELKPQFLLVLTQSAQLAHTEAEARVGEVWHTAVAAARLYGELYATYAESQPGELNAWASNPSKPLLEFKGNHRELYLETVDVLLDYLVLAQGGAPKSSTSLAAELVRELLRSAIRRVQPEYYVEVATAATYSSTRTFRTLVDKLSMLQSSNIPTSVGVRLRDGLHVLLPPTPAAPRRVDQVPPVYNFTTTIALPGITVALPQISGAMPAVDPMQWFPNYAQIQAPMVTVPTVHFVTQQVHPVHGAVRHPPRRKDTVDISGQGQYYGVGEVPDVETKMEEDDEDSGNVQIKRERELEEDKKPTDGDRAQRSRSSWLRNVPTRWSKITASVKGTGRSHTESERDSVFSGALRKFAMGNVASTPEPVPRASTPNPTPSKRVSMQPPRSSTPTLKRDSSSHQLGQTTVRPALKRDASSPQLTTTRAPAAPPGLDTFKKNFMKKKRATLQPKGSASGHHTGTGTEDEDDESISTKLSGISLTKELQSPVSTSPVEISAGKKAAAAPGKWSHAAVQLHKAIPAEILLLTQAMERLWLTGDTSAITGALRSSFLATTAVLDALFRPLGVAVLIMSSQKDSTSESSSNIQDSRKAIEDACKCVKALRDEGLVDAVEVLRAFARNVRGTSVHEDVEVSLRREAAVEVIVRAFLVSGAFSIADVAGPEFYGDDEEFYEEDEQEEEEGTKGLESVPQIVVGA
ncbi:hypothetical protein BJ742DRAFT_780521 [Cladochytrium replicatum]|nr:hypothetical protein BJ742DRAFT_780521 [Cladochytrium replicatum]